MILCDDCERVAKLDKRIGALETLIGRLMQDKKENLEDWFKCQQREGEAKRKIVELEAEPRLTEREKEETVWAIRYFIETATHGGKDAEEDDCAGLNPKSPRYKPLKSVLEKFQNFNFRGKESLSER